jgi:tRNA U38,U39,U40 pseudouridine synthase TruA
VLCVELVGNRFLRRMVRVLVATAIRESIPEAARYPQADDALLLIAGERDRLASAPGAPGEGLGFCEAGCA